MKNQTRSAARAALLLLPLVLVAPAPALAAQSDSAGVRWIEVMRGDDGTTVSIDSASIGRTDDSTFRVRTAIRFAEPVQAAGGRTVDREVDVEELDCGAAQSRGVVSGLYSDTALVSAVALPAKWTPVEEARRPVFDARCRYLLGSFAAALPIADAIEEMPELVNRSAVVRALKEAYPAWMHGEIGDVVVRFRLDTDGKVDLSTLEVVSSTAPAFSDAARRVAPVLRFRPARVDGRPVRVWTTLPLRFEP